MGKYDKLFEAMGKGIPVQFLNALASEESGQDPKAKNPAGTATGLFQIVKGTLDTFNRNNAIVPPYTMDDMTDPGKNTEVACWALHQIMNTYRKTTHFLASPRWNDPRYTDLLWLGYGAGFSDVQGVSYIVQKMEAAGVPSNKITAENVIDMASILTPKSRLWVDPNLKDKDGKGPYMSDPTLRHALTRFREYLAKEVQGDPMPAAPPYEPPGGKDRTLTYIGLGAAGIFALVALSRG